MSISGELQQAHLAFFERELWAPSLSLRQLVSADELDFAPRIPHFYSLELMLWVSVGAGIGFFDRERVNRVVSASRARAEAGYQFLPPEFREYYSATSFALASDNTRAELVSGRIDDANQVRLCAIFLSHLLNDSEVMGEPDAVLFLDTIVSAPYDVWGRIVDRRKAWVGSLARLTSGFARVLQYLTTGVDISPDGPEERDVATRERSWRHRRELTLLLREFQMRRLGLEDPARATRYLEFAGTITGRYQSVEHLDPERRVFNVLHELILKWCGNAREWRRSSDDEQRWWGVYSLSLERSRRASAGARLQL